MPGASQHGSAPWRSGGIVPANRICFVVLFTGGQQVSREITCVTQSPAYAKWLARTAMTIALSVAIGPMFAQSPPPSPDRTWHSSDERQIITEGRRLHSPALRIESDRAYSLA